MHHLVLSNTVVWVNALTSFTWDCLQWNQSKYAHIYKKRDRTPDLKPMVLVHAFIFFHYKVWKLNLTFQYTCILRKYFEDSLLLEPFKTRIGVIHNKKSSSLTPRETYWDCDIICLIKHNNHMLRTQTHKCNKRGLHTETKRHSKSNANTLIHICSYFNHHNMLHIRGINSSMHGFIFSNKTTVIFN